MMAWIRDNKGTWWNADRFKMVDVYPNGEGGWRVIADQSLGGGTPLGGTHESEALARTAMWSMFDRARG
jgi:hypothetical protein